MVYSLKNQIRSEVHHVEHIDDDTTTPSLLETFRQVNTHPQPPSPGDPGVPHCNIVFNGELSIKTSYDMLRTRNNTEDKLNPIFEKVWKWKGRARIRATL